MRIRTFCQTVSADMKIIIWKLPKGKPYDPTVTYFYVNLYLQAAKTIWILKVRTGKLSSWCYSRKWGHVVCPRLILFLFVFGVNQEKQGVSKILLCKVVESFSQNLLRTIISYWAELYWEFCRTSRMELPYKNKQWS